MGHRRRASSGYKRNGSPRRSGSQSNRNYHTICNSITCCRHGMPCAKTLRQAHKSPRFGSDGGAFNSASIFNDEDETGYANLEKLSGDSDEHKSDEPEVRASYEAIQDLTESEGKKKSTTPLKSASSTSVRPRSLSPLPLERSLYEKSNVSWYLGEMTRKQAEDCCRRPVSFRLYHRIPSRPVGHGGHLPPLLPLFVAYCTSGGKHCHYRVITRKEESHEFRIDIWGEPFFSSLSALIAYYTTYVFVDRENGSADYFPWWLTKSDYSNPSDIYE